MRLKNYTMLVLLSAFVFLAGCRSTTIAPTSIDYSDGKCASGYFWSNGGGGCVPKTRYYDIIHSMNPMSSVVKEGDGCTSGYYWSNGGGGCVSKTRSHSIIPSAVATASVSECRKAERHRDFYSSKLNRNLFSGLITTALIGQDGFDGRKHDRYELMEEQASEFLSVNNCYAPRK